MIALSSILLTKCNIFFWLKKHFKCQVDLGKLDRINPISRYFGFDRGKPIDRYYIEKFLLENRKYIHGSVLEVGDNTYTKKFGEGRVERSDVLHAVRGNPSATIVANLAEAENIPSNLFDCIILTQTLQFVYDLPAAVKHLHRILKPEGVILATVPGISQISRYDMDKWGEFWRFTTQSAQRLFEHEFTPANVDVRAYGNILIAVALLHGLAVEDVKTEYFEYQDPDYQVLITIRAIKSQVNQ